MMLWAHQSADLAGCGVISLGQSLRGEGRVEGTILYTLSRRVIRLPETVTNYAFPSLSIEARVNPEKAK